MRTLASRAGFSPSVISQVELNRASPSIGSLERIVSALGVTLSEFFRDPGVETTTVSRLDKRQRLTSWWSSLAKPAALVETDYNTRDGRRQPPREPGASSRRRAGSSSSPISRMLASACPSGMPLQWVRSTRKLPPISSQQGRSCS